MSDGGFLWYGATRTALGDVPVRDFHAYQPGRYYWSAFWMTFFGHSDFTLKASYALFHAIGFTFGLLALKRASIPRVLFIFTAFILLIWSNTLYKSFEPAIASIGVFFAVWLIENPSKRRHLACGVFVGIAAFFGHNHGLYMLLSFSALTTLLALKYKDTEKLGKYGYFLTGILIGNTPTLIMLASIPGYFPSYIESINRVFVYGTNLPKPIPWPWIADGEKSFILGIVLLISPVIYLAVLYKSFLWEKDKLKDNRVLIASAVIGVTYLHRAFSRADVMHIAQSTTPFIIMLFPLVLSCTLKFKKTVILFTSCSILYASYILTIQRKPFFYHLKYPQKFSSTTIHNHKITARKLTIEIIDRTVQFKKQHMKPDDRILILTGKPALYVILNEISPIWEIYFSYHEPIDKQLAVINSIERQKIKWVILDDPGYDNDKILLFKNTNKLIWEYIVVNYKPTDEAPLPDGSIFLQRISDD